MRQLSTIDAVIIEITQEQNRDFEFIDVPIKMEGDNIKNYWHATETLMINGGYFNFDFTPDGFCKINGKIIQKDISKKLSGFVALGKRGALHLLTKKDDLTLFPDVIQAGPYIIDPGGQIGIHSDDGLPAARTLIGKTKDDRIIIMSTKPETLYKLAHKIKRSIPDIERVLNLDGGPSTAMLTPNIKIINPSPVRNYIVKRRFTKRH